jgi:hypothetical protein
MQRFFSEALMEQRKLWKKRNVSLINRRNFKALQRNHSPFSVTQLEIEFSYVIVDDDVSGTLSKASLFQAFHAHRNIINKKAESS